MKEFNFKGENASRYVSGEGRGEEIFLYIF